MPAEFNAERAQFYPSNDLAYAWFKDRVIEVLTTWQDADIKDINDCIEVHECKRTIEVHEHIFSESQIDVLHSRARTLFGLACKHASLLLKTASITDLYGMLEIQYCEQIWDFLVASDLYKQIDCDDFLRLLLGNPHTFGDIVKHKPLVDAFDSEITSAFIDNANIAAELIIRLLGSDNHFDGYIVLPKSLKNPAIDEMMLSYLESPNANLNHVRVLETWPREALNAYKPSADVLVSAKKSASRLTAELFQSDAITSMRYGVGVLISPDQKPCKGIAVKGSTYTLSFSAEWISAYTDPGTILNNFIYVFDFVDSHGLLMAPSNKHERNALVETLGVHVREEYPKSMSFNMRNTQALSIVLAYRRFLLEAGTRLEEAVEWFFNDYIEDEFGISGFSISLPTEETSMFDKCKSIGPEIERVVKAFQLFVDRGEIDSDYFRHMQIKHFESLPSLLGKKYLVEGKSLFRYGNALFSDQSMLAHCPDHRSFRSFIDAITTNDLTIADFYEGCSASLEELVNEGFICISVDGFIETTPKTKLLYRVWQRGAFPMCLLPEELKATVDGLISERMLEYSEHLLTPNEADYMNFMFNDAKFSNSMALRNRYDHADGAVSDPNSQGIEHDYCYLLTLLICLVLKINEELSVFTGKGGVEDFVDWPWIDEKMLNDILTRMPQGQE